LYGSWEKESLKIWAELAKISHTVVDVGANTGIYSLLAKNNNPGSVVLAIEPVDINFEVLSMNIKENEFDILAEKVALSDKEGTAVMFMLKDRLNYMTSVNDNRYAGHPEIQGDAQIVQISVPTIPFSVIHTKHHLGKVDLIKIDVEGHEIAVLKAMLQFIEEFKPVILLEVIGEENAVALDTFFRGLGYRFVCIDEINKSRVVDLLWNNNHHNFLICHDSTIAYLRGKGLVA
jgi:FkbM family methyltransferase